MPDLTSIDETQLASEGFTEHGVEQFGKAVRQYGDALHSRAVLRADADKPPSASREATNKHVREAARDLAAKPLNTATPLTIVGQVSEYLLTAGAGVGAGHLDKQPGIVAFGVCLALATILLVTRLVKGRNS